MAPRTLEATVYFIGYQTFLNSANSNSKSNDKTFTQSNHHDVFNSAIEKNYIYEPPRRFSGVSAMVDYYRSIRNSFFL